MYLTWNIGFSVITTTTSRYQLENKDNFENMMNSIEKFKIQNGHFGIILENKTLYPQNNS